MNKDKIKESVRTSIQKNIEQKGIVTSIDVLIDLERITKDGYEKWRKKEVPYLERVCKGSLGKLSTIMKELRWQARELGLKESYTKYMSWGKKKKVPLRFSKSGNEKLEYVYSLCYLKPNKKEKDVVKPAV